MKNKIEYQITKLSQLSDSQIEQAISLFIDGFYCIFSKMGVSKDKALLQKLFLDAFDYDMAFVCLNEENVVGFLGVGDINKRSVHLKEETCKQLLGKFKGTMVYKQMGKILHEITVHDATEGYLDYLTTDSGHRGKGIATKLINHVCSTLPYKQYALDVYTNNTNAKRLYEHLGFVPVCVKKNPLMMLTGMGSQIEMKVEVEKFYSLIRTNEKL